jgi:hypothetical protein
VDTTQLNQVVPIPTDIIANEQDNAQDDEYYEDDEEDDEDNN